MTMSANAVTHTSVEHIANALEKFAPAVAVRLSERARNAGALPARQRPPAVDPAVVTSSEVFRPDAWALAQQMLGCRLADYYGQAERIAFASANAPRRVPLSAWLFVRRIHSVRRAAAAARQPAPAVRDRRHVVLEQPAAHRAVSHRRSGAAAGELGRTRARRAVAGAAHVPRRARPRAGTDRLSARPSASPASAACRAMSSNVLRFQVVQEDFDSARILVLPDRGVLRRRTREDLLANARARIPRRGERSTVEIAHAARAHAARQDAAHRAPAAGPRCACAAHGVEPLFTR